MIEVSGFSDLYLVSAVLDRLQQMTAKRNDPMTPKAYDQFLPCALHQSTIRNPQSLRLARLARPPVSPRSMPYAGRMGH